MTPKKQRFILFLGIYVLFFFNIMYCKSMPNATDKKATDYIAKYKNLAIREYKRVGIPVCIKLAQGILESGYGTARLAKQGNNHFGIKCKSFWKGDTLLVNDDALQECFRKYKSASDSYKDHSLFLKNHYNHNYDHLFAIPNKNYVQWANGIQQGGYATKKDYAETLIEIIERYELYKLDTIECLYNSKYLLAQKIEMQQKQLAAAIKPTALPNSAPLPHTATPPKAPKPLIIASKVKDTKKQPVPNIEVTTNEMPTDTATATIPYHSKSVQHLPYIHKHGYTMPNNELVTSPLQKINNLTCVFIQNLPLTPSYISSLYKVSLEALYKHNDISLGSVFAPNTPVFFEAKKRKNKALANEYVVATNETMHQIAQKTGIKEHCLYKRNKLKDTEQPADGAIIFLNKRNRHAPPRRVENFNWGAF